MSDKRRTVWGRFFRYRPRVIEWRKQMRNRRCCGDGSVDSNVSAFSGGAVVVFDIVVVVANVIHVAAITPLMTAIVITSTV